MSNWRSDACVSLLQGALVTLRRRLRDWQFAAPAVTVTTWGGFTLVIWRPAAGCPVVSRP